MLRILYPATAALLLAACQTAPLPAGATLYHGFTLIDPATETVTPDAWIVVASGRIAQVGAGRLPAAEPARTRDLEGRYLLPGFIDAHAHITHSGMQQIEVKDGAVSIRMDSIDRITRHNGRIALARGVTTVRNPGGDTDANARYNRMIASGDWIGPEALHAGAVIQPPPFVGGSFAYPRDAAAWDAEAARQKAAGMTYFKLYVSLTEDELALGVAAANRHGLVPIAHLDKISWSRAVDLGVEQLEHALPTSPDLLTPEARTAYLANPRHDSTFMYRWFELADMDGPLIRDLARKLAERKIAVDLTLVVNELVYNVDDVRAHWASIDLEDAPPEVMATYLPQIEASATGWTPEDFIRARAALHKVKDFARVLYDAGVPMMIGTDAGGGIFYARELELHTEAGIPAWAVLRMATSGAAAIMGMDDRIGRIAPGLEADLVILDADPVSNVSAARQIHGVLNNGVYMRSDDLRKAAREALP